MQSAGGARVRLGGAHIYSGAHCWQQRQRSGGEEVGVCGNFRAEEARQENRGAERVGMSDW